MGAYATADFQSVNAGQHEVEDNQIIALGPNLRPTRIAIERQIGLRGYIEGGIPLDAVIYLGTAPKSNAAYRAQGAATAAARESGSLMPPAHILNAPTRLMQELGYGRGYQYDHNAEDAFSGQNYFPDGMARQRFYMPSARGFEKDVQARIAYWDRLRAAKGQP